MIEVVLPVSFRSKEAEARNLDRRLPEFPLPRGQRSLPVSPSPRLAFALAVLLMIGCAAQAVKDRRLKNKIPDEAKAVLEKSGQFELYSLEPDRNSQPAKDNFHGFNVLGKTLIKEPETRKQLVAALEKAVEESDGRVTQCFNPRHGIRVTHGGATVDFVICFQCYRVAVFTGDAELPRVLITRSPQAVFDKALQDAGVPLADKGN